MDLKGVFGKAKKLASEHQSEVDKAIDLATKEVKDHTPNSVDKAVDGAARKAKEEI